LFNVAIGRGDDAGGGFDLLVGADAPERPLLQNAQWMNFYTKVLSTYASGKGLKITLQLEASPENGISPQKIDVTKMVLRELGLPDNVEAECPAIQIIHPMPQTLWTAQFDEWWLSWPKRIRSPAFFGPTVLPRVW